MPNLLTLTVPIALPNLSKAKIGRILVMDEDNGVLVFELQLGSAAGLLYPSVFALTVTNTTGCDALVANAAPTTLLDVALQLRLTPASTLNAFNAALAAYRAAGTDKRGNLITALQGITGIVQAGPLANQVVPILPAGVVT